MGKSILEIIKRYIENNQMISPGSKVIIAVSGGPDSMALLYIMKEISSYLGFTIIAAHLNHCLREAADDEEALVRARCQDWNIPFYSRKVAVGQLAREQKKSIEEMGREVRYQYFFELLEKQDAQLVATAHHRDDVAETVLLHLLRGTGLSGLKGIMPISGRLIRPLLPVSKGELLDFLAERQISYCLDQSNLDPAFLRNRIRYRLIPYLQRDFNPRIVESLNQLADIVREEENMLEEQCEHYWVEGVFVGQEGEKLVLNSQVLNTLPLALRRRLVRKALATIAGRSGWELNDVDQILNLSTKKGSSYQLKLKKKVKVIKSYDRMFFTTSWKQGQGFCYSISPPETLTIKETGETYLFWLQEKANLTLTGGEMVLDYERLPVPLYLRSRRPGDFFRPVGMKGRKKLQDFFVDLKIPYFQRDNIPLLASAAGEIYAVLGFRVSRQAMVQDGSKRLLVIKRL